MNRNYHLISFILVDLPGKENSMVNEGENEDWLIIAQNQVGRQMLHFFTDTWETDSSTVRKGAKFDLTLNV